MRSLRREMNGISGTACYHGNVPWEDGPVRYEACEKHHGDAAFSIAQKWIYEWLQSSDLHEAIRERLESAVGSWLPDEDADLIIDSILDEIYQNVTPLMQD